MSARKPRFEVVRSNAGCAIYLVTRSQPFDVQGAWFISTSGGSREVRILDERTGQ